MTVAKSIAIERNPWPCEGCGSPISLGKRAGRLPLSAWLAVLLFGAMVLLGLVNWHAVNSQWFMVLLLPWLLVALALHASQRRQWQCRRCTLWSVGRLHPSGMPSVVLVVPTYNNAGSIEQVIADIFAHASSLPLLVVNDGSTDQTGALAQGQIATLYSKGRAHVLHHLRNQGKGAALRSALRYALEHHYSHIICLDGDGQHFAKDIEVLLTAVQKEPHAIVVGARDLSGENVQQSSRFGRAFSNFWLRVQTGVALADSQSGFRAYPTASCLSIGARGKAYDFEVEALTLGARAGIPLRAVPIAVYYPPASERVSHFDKLWDNVRISWLNIRLLLGAVLWPLGWPARLSAQSPPAPLVRPWSGTSRGGMLGHLFFLSVLKWVGKKPAYLMLYPVVFYFMFFAPKAVRASAAFLDLASGERPRGLRRFGRSYGHVLQFSQQILDRALVRVRGPQEVHYTSTGHEEVQAALAHGRGALFLSAHLGNYELGGMLFNHRYGVPVNVVMMDNEAAAVKAVHEKFGRDENLKIIATNRSSFPALRILQALRSGEIVALHGDRVITKDWLLAPFFGQPAPFPTGIFAIAAAARTPVILTFGIKDAGTYHFIAEPGRFIELPRGRRDSALEDHVQWYAARLEDYARRHPMQWFNFYDFWQQPDPGESPQN